jgi:hypothetical protein
VGKILLARRAFSPYDDRTLATHGLPWALFRAPIIRASRRLRLGVGPVVVRQHAPYASASGQFGLARSDAKIRLQGRTDAERVAEAYRRRVAISPEHDGGNMD